MLRIAQIGTFDVENFGDLLFPDVLDYFLGSKFEIDLYSPIGGIKPFDTKCVFPIEDLEKNIANYSALIIGGGDIIRTDSKICIKNDCYGESSDPSLQLWAYPIILAKRYGIPVIFNAVGIPNDFRYDESFIVNYLINKVDYITVRDTEAQNALLSIGIDKSIIIPDTVFSISKIISRSDNEVLFNKLIEDELVPNIGEYIVFQHNSTNIDDRKYYRNVIELLKNVSADYKILLMPIGYVHDDDKILNKIYKENISNIYMVNMKRKLSPKEMIAILSNSSGYIGTSMHGAVVSSSYNKRIMILNQMNSKKLHGISNVLCKTVLNANDSNNYSYVYNNYFDNQQVSLPTNIIKKIQNHFENICKLIQFGSNNSNINLDDFIHEYYNNYNLDELYCSFYESDYLKRRIIRYTNNSNVYKANIKSNNGMHFKVVNSGAIYVDYLKINGIVKIKNSFVNSDYEILCKPKNSNISVELKCSVVRGEDVISGLVSNINEQNRNVDYLKQEVIRVKDEKEQIQKELMELRNNYDLVINSRTWKLRNKIEKLFKK